MAVFVSPTAGTRNTPKDGLVFVRGTTATIKITFETNGSPTTVDVGTDPVLKVFQPRFLENDGFANTDLLFTTTGSLVAGQQFEYEFTWDIPGNIIASDEYILVYEAFIGGVYLQYGDELCTIQSGPGQVGVRSYGYATVDDIRNKKFNIDDYLPKVIAKDLEKRNALIQSHIRDATEKLQEELNLHQSRAMSVNYRLFAIYYTIWSILLASRGEDGSSVSDQNLSYWRREWESILAQEKREGQMQGVPLGRG